MKRPLVEEMLRKAGVRETLADTMRHWLRKWLGIEGLSRQIVADQLRTTDELEGVKAKARHESQRLDAVGRIVQEKLDKALAEVENTRQDLIQRMTDLSLEIADTKKKPAVEESKEVVSPGHIPFSVRRRQAQHTGTNASAYLAPKNKP